METKVREFHSKLLLGACATNAGFDVVLGEQLELKRKLEFLPRGIMLEKGVTTHMAPDLMRTRSMGNRLVAWCEEGLVYRNREAYLRDRICLPAMETVDRFFAWGKHHARDLMTKVTGVDEKLVVTGNPRFDLLRPELRDLFRREAYQLRQVHGPYILIATNFGRVNHFRGAEYVSRLLDARGARATGELAEFTEQWSSFLAQIYQAFLTMVPQLARALPDTPIILRPHPSEDRESWIRALADQPNVKVIHEGSVIPWILGADALIHNSCTTGVEAYLLDVPGISYRPATSEMLDSKLPNAVSHQAFTCEELIDLARTVISGEGIPGFTSEEAARRRATLVGYVEGIQGPMASEQIVAALKQIPIEAQALNQSGVNRFSMLATDVVSSARNAAAAATGRVVVGRAYRRHKFPGLEVAELNQSLEGLSQFSESLRGITAVPVLGMRNVARLTQSDLPREA
jgi:surface carbohydrate biosynthesis protein